MVQMKPVLDRRTRKIVYAEISPETCRNGHAQMRPEWGGCDYRGHRYWKCADCGDVIIDSDCECQAGVSGDAAPGSPGPT